MSRRFRWVVSGRRTLAMLACAGVAMGMQVARAHEEGSCEHEKSFAARWSGMDADAAGFDASTGRDLRNFPRDRIVDYTHMLLDVFIPDMNRPRALVTQTLTFSPISAPLESLRLDARAFEIRAVQVDGHASSFEHDGRTLTVRFDPPLPPDQPAVMRTTYLLSDPPRGLVWTLEDPAWGSRPPQIHTQGQPETNSYWFPAHDFPNERLSTEMIVTVPAGFLVSGNGRLASKERVIREVPDAVRSGPSLLQPFDRFRWVQEREHVNYLVSLVVGKFDVVDIGDGTLPMPVYVPPGRASDVRRTYGNTLPMLRLYERVLDEPYPWAQYAQLVVHNFEAGGMENTSASTMFDTAIYSPDATLDHDLDGLISHELAHQWFGDLITCNSWEYIWLNEGFATYLESLWFEQRDGKDGYVRDTIENFDRVIAADTGTLPATPGMASKVWEHPWETFRRSSNPYPKGASVLHMLRAKLGDEVFFRGLVRYIDQHKDSTVENVDFRRSMEEASGLQLEQFFDQWTRRPGVPRLDVSFQYDPTRAKLRVDVRQTQPIDGDNPAFDVSLPIYIKNTRGPDVVIEPRVSAQSDSFEVDLEGPPAFVAVNHSLGLLAEVRTSQSPEQWLEQLRTGPGLAARVQAARALERAPAAAPIEPGSPLEVASSEPLRAIAADRGEHPFLRVACVKALAARNARNDILAMSTTVTDDWEVRRALVEGIETLARREDNAQDRSLRDSAVRTLLSRAQRDPSLRVRNAALQALASLRVPEGLAVVRDALKSESQSDGARQTALRALRDYRPADALELASFYAGPGFDSRTRAVAIEVLTGLVQGGETGPHSSKLAPRDLVHARLAQSLGVRENRVRMAAAEGLVTMGEARGLPLLLDAAETARAPEVAVRFRRLARELEAKLNQPAEQPAR